MIRMIVKQLNAKGMVIDSIVIGVKSETDLSRTAAFMDFCRLSTLMDGCSLKVEKLPDNS